MFDNEEIKAWECEIASRKIFIKKKSYKDPRVQKLKEVRKGIKAVHYDKEIKSCRKDHYRIYRNKITQLVRSEKFDMIVGYKRTSGWLTW
ncbi:hypothetical protein ACFPES_03830 [Paenibacillus sp. GCM10023248]|uniref:hypothetical protein n=1 Tax=unclassified Paenibacillus TaxID=185978 RepID=UPI002378DB93|nr:hypothetical protein [Paenibacillus sp. MAHUQ-63]MDD9266157.1 hypothetical protein [Paenibacillus sp. MAHUQ-63]